MRKVALLVLLLGSCADPVAGPPPPLPEELRRGLELYAKYPPPNWGPHILHEVAARTKNRPLLTPDEREFIAGYELWELARRHLQSAKHKP